MDGNADEDASSLRGSGVKEKLGVLRSSFRGRIRLVAKSPLSPKNKGSKVTAKEDKSGPWPPPSPSPSSRSSLKDDEGEMSPQSSRGLKQSRTDPNLSGFGDALKKVGRRSLRLKKEKNKESKQEPLGEGSPQKKLEEVEEKEVEVQQEEVEEAYVVPDIPDIPLSVMQISKLIEMEVLEEAHLHLLALRREFQQEQEGRGQEDTPMDLAKKEKDLNLLYGDLREKIRTIVRDSNALPSRNKGLLVHVARIIQEEERRAEEPGGLPGSWMETWREAVGEGVRAKVGGVHLEKKEQNVSWLALHLGLLGKAIVEDLEGVRKELRWSYPPSFKVFGAYVSSYHREVGRHLGKLEQQTTELKDLFTLLDWINHRYSSERVMGSMSLQPDMDGEGRELQLEDGLLETLKDKFSTRVKEETRSELDKIIELEDEELWREQKTPETEDDFLSSNMEMDIWTTVKGKIQNSGKIDAELKAKVIISCLKELEPFPKRFMEALRQRCGALRPQLLWTHYHITYINTFTALRQHVDEDRDACPDQWDTFKKEVEWLILQLRQDLEDQFKLDVKPYLRRMMTRKWMTDDGDFNELQKRISCLAEHCSLMRPGAAQEFASGLHYHVVREYIGQLMKNNYSCKNRKHEKAAEKLWHQWKEVRALFEEMGSTHEWLHHAGEDLCNVIGQKNKQDIKKHLQPILEHYPDFRRKHLVAVLYFRGLTRGCEHQQILQSFEELKKSVDKDGNKNCILFSDMPVTVNTDCLSNLPFSCFPLPPRS